MHAVAVMGQKRRRRLVVTRWDMLAELETRIQALGARIDETWRGL